MRTAFDSAGLAHPQRPAAPPRMRPFGSSPGDIDVQFEERNRLALELEVLRLCCATAEGEAASEAMVLDWTIGERTETLVKLACLSDRRPLAWGFRCDGPECGTENEIEIELDELTGLADGTRGRQTLETEVAGRPVVLRKPTGRDQLRWLEAPGPIGPEMVLAALVESPGLEGLGADLPLDEIEREVDRAMEEFDPLTSFEMVAVCAGCGAAKTVVLELGQAALDRLAAEQQKLVMEVHVLASHYHWEEAAILRLPAWRREYYLERIDREQSGTADWLA